MSSLTVAICTRNRPAQLRRALAALAAQHDRAFDVLVVDQSDEPADDVETPGLSVTHLPDTGRGLSRARNIALERARSSDWLLFVDDDCLLAPEFIERTRRVLAAHPEAAFVSPHVEAGVAPSPEHLPAAARGVFAERVRKGRWTRPDHIGFGVCMLVRRDVAVRLGGWDERLGPGSQAFAASDDVDFNYRLLRSGAACVATPELRCRHDEWRSPEDSIRLYGGYAAAWAGFAVKHLRTGDRLGGSWLWAIGAANIARLALSGIRHRSDVRRRAARAQGHGYLAGTALAARRSW